METFTINQEVYENIFSMKELQILINWADNQPVSNFQGLDAARTIDVNKSLHYIYLDS